MSIILKDYDLKQLHEIADSHYTVSVNLNKGQLIKLLKGTIDPLRGFQTYVVKDSLLFGNLIHLEVKLLSQVDKINVGFVSSTIDTNTYKGFEENSGVPRDALMRRGQYILGFAVSTYLKDSSVNMFKGNVNNWEILFSFIHAELIELLGDNLTLSGSFDKDIVTIFNYFWYRFPVDLTGYDTKIINASLEQGLMMGH